jgi:hypothetical protein
MHSLCLDSRSPFYDDLASGYPRLERLELSVSLDLDALHALFVSLLRAKPKLMELLLSVSHELTKNGSVMPDSFYEMGRELRSLEMLVLRNEAGLGPLVLRNGPLELVDSERFLQAFAGLSVLGLYDVMLRPDCCPRVLILDVRITANTFERLGAEPAFAARVEQAAGLIAQQQQLLALCFWVCPTAADEGLEIPALDLQQLTQVRAVSLFGVNVAGDLPPRIEVFDLGRSPADQLRLPDDIRVLKLFECPNLRSVDNLRVDARLFVSKCPVDQWLRQHSSNGLIAITDGSARAGATIDETPGDSGDLDDDETPDDETPDDSDDSDDMSEGMSEAQMDLDDFSWSPCYADQLANADELIPLFGLFI